MPTQRLLPQLPAGWDWPYPRYGSGPVRPDKVFRGYVIFHQRQPVRGGAFEVSVVEVYDDSMNLYWRFIPDLPAFQETFREELRQARINRIMRIKRRPDVYSEDELSDAGYRFLDEVVVAETVVARSLRFGDDLGTSYDKWGEGFAWSSRQFIDIRGDAWYRPSLHPETASLWVTAMDVTLVADLRHP